MGMHEEISEVTRADVRDAWVVTRCVSTTAKKFGLTNQIGSLRLHGGRMFFEAPEPVHRGILDRHEAE
jgi:hypothetical protein